MLISPINIVAYQNNKINFQPSFCSTIKKVSVPNGILKKDTRFLVEDILHAYKDILSKLELKTEKGLEILSQKYKDIRIGDTLGFYNCGEDRDTIIISIGKMNKNKNLTYISRREGHRGDKEGNLKESFMLEGKEKLVKNFDKEYSKHFPAEREYFTQEEIDSIGCEEQLYKLLQDLDSSMLKFRKFLELNMNDNLKLPDGRIPYQSIMDIRQAFKTCSEIDEISKNIKRLKLYDLNRGFKNYYSVTGLDSYVFKDLGEEQVTINLSQVRREGEDLKRLSVYDKEGKPIKVFLIENEEKFISNLRNNTPNFLPEKYLYADTKEVEEKFTPEFNKYLKLYMDKLSEYKKYLETYVKNEEDRKKVGTFGTEMYYVLKDSVELLKNAKATLRKFDSRKASVIKQEVGALDKNFKEQGIWFNDKEQGKTVQLLPVNNKRQTGLCRITIMDNETKERQLFLIKDYTYLVKNYNPKIPENIPPKLFYASIAEVEDVNLLHCCRFIKTKLEELNAYADYEFERRNMPKPKKEKVVRPRQVSPERGQKQILKDCKKQFKEALNNLDSGLESFNATMQNIQEKIAELLKNKQQA